MRDDIQLFVASMLESFGFEWFPLDHDDVEEGCKVKITQESVNSRRRS